MSPAAPGTEGDRPILDPVGLDAQIDRFVRPCRSPDGCDQASVDDYAALAMACDRLWLADATAVGGGSRDPLPTCTIRA